MADEADGARAARDLARWQRALLPFLIAAISLMAVFFFVSSLWQLERLSATIGYKPNAKVEQLMARYDAAPAPQADAAAQQDQLRWKTLVLLEREAISHRYAQVNATLMLRAWTRHLGFLTGMILALVGAIFILAKLREEGTSLSAEGQGLKGALETSSPGIVLAVLGTVLMVVTLTISFEFSTTDVPVYIAPYGVTPAAAGAMPPPGAFENAADLASEESKLFGASAPEAQDEK